VSRPRRNPDPNSLAESLAEAGARCRIPYTHDRLHETHHWWHEIARNYHEPDPFRYALGAFIQAARNVTFMLQKEKTEFQDFGWYTDWSEHAKTDPVLRWLGKARTGVVHQHALEPHSWLEMRCVGNPRIQDDEEDEIPLVKKVSPFRCTHTYVNLGGPWKTDHTHEFTRHWSIEGLGERELLEVCADIYDRLDELVVDAHERLGNSVTSFKREGAKRFLPCMEGTLAHRIVRTVLREGIEVIDKADQVANLH
jgi:hypothetical protein